LRLVGLARLRLLRAALRLRRLCRLLGGCRGLPRLFSRRTVITAVTAFFLANGRGRRALRWLYRFASRPLALLFAPLRRWPLLFDLSGNVRGWGGRSILAVALSAPLPLVIFVIFLGGNFLGDSLLKLWGRPGLRDQRRAAYRLGGARKGEKG
jgi:hypothetical protein